MKTIGTLFLFLLLACNTGFGQNLTVHEWGTFTTMHGSNGSTLSGLYFEEEQLPSFVYHFPGFSPDPVRSECSNVTVKMETPVLYFYSPVQRSVKVHVDFPMGAISQWYPQRSGGEIIPTGTNLDFGNSERVGGIDWDATILDPKSQTPYTQQSVIKKWQDPRNTDANLVQNSDGETEGYLFYRGLANFSLPLSIQFNPKGDLTVTNTSSLPISFIYIYDFSKPTEGLRLWGTGPLPANGSTTFKKPLPLPYDGPPALDTFQLALEAAGLTSKEAWALLQTWTDGYFQTEGFKVFWIVPRPLTDAILPISISPKPDTLERVLVGKTEILSPEFEAQLLIDFQSGMDNFDAKWKNHHYYLAYKQRAEQLAAMASVSSTDNSDAIAISPNPATNNIHVLGASIVPGATMITIRNILGVVVLSTQIGNNQDIYIHDFPSGLYTITVSSSQRHWTSKLLKL